MQKLFLEVESDPRNRERSRSRVSKSVVALIIAAGLIAAGFVVSNSPGFATVPAPASYSVWSAATSPRNVTDPDRSWVQLGVKFTSSDAGWIKAIRFFKSRENVGKHVGQLWTSSGKLLAVTSFVNETSSGWQQAALPTPVKVVPGESYVASYTAPGGGYSDDQNSLSPTRPKKNYSLTATQGLYSYDSRVPRFSWDDSNYYVDVVFATRAAEAGTGTSTTPTSTRVGASPTTVRTAPPVPSTPATTTRPAPSTSRPTPQPTKTAPAPTGGTSTGAWPDASNTGSHGTLPTRPSMTITADGTTISDVQVNGQITVRANNVTLRNVHVVSRGSYYGALVYGKNLLIEDSTFEGTSDTLAGICSINGGQFVANRVNVFGSEDGIRMQDGSKLNDSFVHDLAKTESSHNDGVTADGSTGWEIVHNTILNSINETGAVWIGDPRYGPSEGLLKNNLLAGGGWTIYSGPASGVGLRVVGNQFSTRYFPKSGYWGVVAYWTSDDTLWSANTWADGPNAGALIDP